ncbi:MAG TPA: tetratricopeptide repeat protein [candidate division Zixibacteria bacterium]|nr:tetratricopeptide repeat protein [candidate division Zixibacteria bacterium]
MASVQGNVEVRRSGQTQWQPARLNDAYCPGDRIQVGERSRADIALANQPVLRLDQNTTITLAGIKEDRASLIDLARGALHFFSRHPRNLEVHTAFVNAGVEGTEGLVEVQADRTLITIFEGRVLAANPAGSLSLTGGQSAVAEKGRAPVLRTVVRPRDAVQWALYYPPVGHFRPRDFEGPEPWRAMARKSLEAYNRGDYAAAFEAIKGAPPDVREARFFAYRAQLLLGVGRVDEASKDIERALGLNPDSGDALALRSVIAVVQNDKERALDTAGKAVAADPKSTSALIAQSYARQANFDLEGARASLQQAVAVRPDDALAWARLAELHMSFGDLDDALEAAQKAAALDPDLSRTQMVLGFAYLLRVSTDEAKAAFEKAIALDQADSLSRLGLGLAKIRESNFEAGRKEIEIAASLDPNNSIVRSYLGKAYYEEKRSDVAEREYAAAKELDPKDPTPYFYDAIRKQTTNRPVEALQDMEKAIELNDNRAVYRSRLQLDADLAARSASLARIYSDLGFQQLALVEGWKSVNADPTNFSAHRFLADSYSVLPRHEIARVSELLQSQLLQPLNMTPIQPRLGEGNLGLISAGGPGALSFNEFNPIFTRNGVTFQGSALAGENSTYAGEGVLAAVYKRLSFSIGGSRFQTDGWARNRDQEDSIANAFFQLELSPETSVQAEYRYRNKQTGDLILRFFPDNFFPGERNKEERNTFRLGARHAFTPNSILLASIVYQDAQVNKRDFGPVDIPIFTFEGFKRPETAFGQELQHLFRSQYVNLVTGAGHVDIKGILDITFATIFPPPDDLIFSRLSLNLRHNNVYAYSYITPLKNLTFTLGVSGDFTRGDAADTKRINQANPKAGVTWNPFPGTTLRASAFRVLKRTLITNATLEPTQVAGFNQFFDDINGTKAWRYGAAIDQKFTREIFGGVEVSKRDLNVPAFDEFGNPTRVNWKERLARTYLFWTPHPWLALRAEYHYERDRESPLLTDGVLSLNTHRVPLGLTFFHPSGLGGFLTATYYHQDGKFQRVNFDLESGRADFWTVDLGIRYRLPDRYGFLTLGATNIADRKFKFFNRDFNNPNIQPKRAAFAQITLALP